MDTQNTGTLVAEERAHVSALLACYPDISPEDLAELHNWFDRVATPLDLGLLASDPAIRPQYQAYRAQHYDRMKSTDMVRAALFIGLVLLILVGLGLAMP